MIIQYKYLELAKTTVLVTIVLVRFTKGLKQ